MTRVVKTIVCLLTPLLICVTAGGRERPFVFGINRVGGEGALFGPPDYTEHMYQRLREVGATAVRLAASPRDIERVQGERDWSDFEEDLALALQYGMEPMVCIVNTPAWASPTGEVTHLYSYKTDTWSAGPEGRSTRRCRSS